MAMAVAAPVARTAVKAARCLFAPISPKRLHQITAPALSPTALGSLQARRTALEESIMVVVSLPITGGGQS